MIFIRSQFCRTKIQKREIIISNARNSLLVRLKNEKNQKSTLWSMHSGNVSDGYGLKQK